MLRNLDIHNKIALLSFVTIFPAFYFFTSAALNEIFNFGILFSPLLYFYETPERLQIWNIISPLLFLFGLLFGIIANLKAITNLGFKFEEGGYKLSFSINLRLWNIIILFTSAALLFFMLAYVFLENLTHPIM